MPRRKSWIAILAFLIVATTLTTAITTPDADASTPLRGKLRVAKREPVSYTHLTLPTIYSV